MDRLFLDANILFSAAYRDNAAVTRLWEVARVELISSQYALSEAERNLRTTEQFERLTGLLNVVTIVGHIAGPSLREGITLPEKDLPILAAAVNSSSTHLITGDVRHFGPYFGKRVAGVLVLLPAEYLRRLSR